jgi:hypothetical protein
LEGPEAKDEAGAVSEHTVLASLCVREDYSKLARCFGGMKVKHLMGFTEKTLMAFVEHKKGPDGLVPAWLVEKQLEQFLKGYVKPDEQGAQKRHAGNLSTPAGVLEWMDSVGREFGFPRRVNAFDPGPRFADEDFGAGVVWDREEVVSGAVRYFRQSLHAIPGSTQGNGLCATLASRGCGKSFVVDLLCRLHNKTHDGSLVLGDELNARLVPVCISFNGPQDVEADRNESAQVQLLSRLAHRAFFDGNPESWSAFSRKTREAWSEIEPEILLDAMLLYFEKIGILCPIVFVALDEVIKCGHSHAVEVLRMLNCSSVATRKGFGCWSQLLMTICLSMAGLQAQICIIKQLKIGNGRARSVRLHGCHCFRCCSRTRSEFC